MAKKKTKQAGAEMEVDIESEPSPSKTQVGQYIANEGHKATVRFAPAAVLKAVKQQVHQKRQQKQKAKARKNSLGGPQAQRAHPSASHTRHGQDSRWFLTAVACNVQRTRFVT